jgi:hypothetical protein
LFLVSLCKVLFGNCGFVYVFFTNFCIQISLYCRICFYVRGEFIKCVEGFKIINKIICYLKLKAKSLSCALINVHVPVYVFLLLCLCILLVCLSMATLAEVCLCFFLSCKANA